MSAQVCRQVKEQCIQVASIRHVGMADGSCLATRLSARQPLDLPRGIGDNPKHSAMREPVVKYVVKSPAHGAGAVF